MGKNIRRKKKSKIIKMRRKAFNKLKQLGVVKLLNELSLDETKAVAKELVATAKDMKDNLVDLMKQDRNEPGIAKETNEYTPNNQVLERFHAYNGDISETLVDDKSQTYTIPDETKTPDEPKAWNIETNEPVATPKKTKVKYMDLPNNQFPGWAIAENGMIKQEYINKSPNELVRAFTSTKGLINKCLTLSLPKNETELVHNFFEKTRFVLGNMLPEHLKSELERKDIEAKEYLTEVFGSKDENVVGLETASEVVKSMQPQDEVVMEQPTAESFFKPAGDLEPIVEQSFANENDNYQVNNNLSMASNGVQFNDEGYSYAPYEVDNIVPEVIESEQPQIDIAVAPVESTFQYDLGQVNQNIPSAFADMTDQEFDNYQTWANAQNQNRELEQQKAQYMNDYADNVLSGNLDGQIAAGQAMVASAEAMKQNQDLANSMNNGNFVSNAEFDKTEPARNSIFAQTTDQEFADYQLWANAQNQNRELEQQQVQQMNEYNESVSSNDLNAQMALGQEMYATAQTVQANQNTITDLNNPNFGTNSDKHEYELEHNSAFAQTTDQQFQTYQQQSVIRNDARRDAVDYQGLRDLYKADYEQSLKNGDVAAQVESLRLMNEATQNLQEAEEISRGGRTI